MLYISFFRAKELFSWQSTRFTLHHPLSGAASANAAAPVVLALDGRCGSGKTTMAAALAEQFPDSIVLHTDDFYLPPADRVPGWEQTPCANMDLARLRDEVLAPARAGKPALYRAYSCRRVLICPCSSLPHSRW